MPKSPGKSLGEMEGLKSYEPDKGWSDIESSNRKVDDQDENFYDDPELNDYKTKNDNENRFVSGSEKTGEKESDSFFEEDFIEDVQESKMSNLARQVAETNSLVDKALGSIDDESTETQGSKSLDELGKSLSELFDQLYDTSDESNLSPWNAISQGLNDLSDRIDKRDNLKEQLRETQELIDKSKLDLIKEIKSVANSEEEKLSIVRMRSRLASVMADKLLNKLS